MDWREHIQADKLPEHIAVIMDGNGRWAKKQGAMRVFGHRSAVKAVRDTTEGCAEVGVKYLTLYAFSTENWNRPKLEVNALMTLLVETLRKEIDTLNKNKIRLKAIGDLSRLPKRTYKTLMEAIHNTRDNNRMTLVLALNYSSRWEILNAVRQLTQQVEEKVLSTADIDESTFVSALSTKDIPDPELLIRTSGEHRISNFLLWQISYTELYFTKVFWPEFRKANFYEAIIEFQNRERRFGKTSDQLS